MIVLLPAEKPVASKVGTWSRAMIGRRAQERYWILPVPDIRKRMIRMIAATPDGRGSCR